MRVTSSRSHPVLGALSSWLLLSALVAAVAVQAAPSSSGSADHPSASIIEGSADIDIHSSSGSGSGRNTDDNNINVVRQPSARRRHHDAIVGAERRDQASTTDTRAVKRKTRRHRRRSGSGSASTSTTTKSCRARANLASTKTTSTKSSSSSVSPGFDVDSVLDQAVALASHSWEYGITAQALLDWDSPDESVFSSSAFPSGKLPKAKASNTPGLKYAKNIIRTNSTTLADGDGALGDPASLAPFALMIGKGSSTSRFTEAATRQMDHVLAGPKFYNGAISQREDVAELWADAVNMIHPSLAYYAVATDDVDLMKTAVNQATKYRQVLRANTTASWEGLWVHIVGPQSQTLGIWSTGNGWAALGMVRVLATIKHWSRTSDWSTYPGHLVDYIEEILKGAKATGTASNGLLKNYLVGDVNGQSNSPNGYDFGDATGSAMLATVAYRLALLGGSKSYVSWADGLRKSIAKVVDSDGIVTQTVDPLNWYSNTPYTKGSPEGQAATVMMAAAYRDCVNANICSS